MELFTERGQIDLNDNFAWSLNYTTADVVDLTKRKASYTKTVKVPYTSKNALIFQGLHEANASNIGYDTKRYLTCFLEHNGQLLIEGVLFVLSWSKLKEAQEIEIQIVARTKNTISNLKNVQLNELDFTHLEHNYTVENIEHSYNGLNVVNGLLQQRDGYIYPLVDYGKDDTIPKRWTIQDMRPSIFLRELFDRLFLTAGQTYTSDFLNSPYWSSIVLLNTLNEIVYTDEQRAPFQTEVENSTEQNTFIDPFSWPVHNIEIPTDVEIDTLVTDSLGQWNLTPSSDPKITIQKTGRYKLTFTTALTIEYAVNFPYLLSLLPGGPGLPFNLTNGTVTQYFQLKRNGAILDSFPITDIILNDTWDQDLTPGAVVNWYTQPVKYISYVLEADLNIGDVLEYRILQDEAVDSGLNPLLVTRFKINDARVVTELVKAVVSPGEQVNFKNYIPQVKANEFVNTVFNTFNLWVIDDPYNTGNLIIEPRTNFFDLGGYVDWSNKRDVSRQTTYDFLADTLPKRFRYKFGTSLDVDVKNYFDENDTGYADFDSEIDTELSQKDQEIKTQFTPLKAQEQNGLIYPRIFKQSEPTEPKQNLGAVLKIGFVKNLTGEYEIDDGTTVHALTNYVAVTEFDNPRKPTFTLTFGDADTDLLQDKAAYWNMYRLFHQLTEEEKTRKGAKVVTMYVNLNENDIRQLDLRRVVYVDQVYYRIVSIDSFNPLSSKPTRVKLLQIEHVKYDFTSNEIIYKSYNLEQPILATNNNEPIITNKNAYVQTD